MRELSCVVVEKEKGERRRRRIVGGDGDGSLGVETGWVWVLTPLWTYSNSSVDVETV